MPKFQRFTQYQTIEAISLIILAAEYIRRQQGLAAAEMAEKLDYFYEEKLSTEQRAYLTDGNWMRRPHK